MTANKYARMSGFIQIDRILQSEKFKLAKTNDWEIVTKYGVLTLSYNRTLVLLEQVYDGKVRYYCEWHFDSLERAQYIPQERVDESEDMDEFARDLVNKIRSLKLEIRTPPYLPRLNRILSTAFPGYYPDERTITIVKTGHRIDVEFRFPTLRIVYYNESLGVRKEYVWVADAWSFKVTATKEKKPETRQKTFTNDQEWVDHIRKIVYRLGGLVAGEMEKIDACSRCFSLAAGFKCTDCLTLYCGQECQIKDWNEGHSQICK